MHMLNEFCVSVDYCVQYVDRVLSLTCGMYQIRKSLNLNYDKLKQTELFSSLYEQQPPCAKAEVG